MNSVCKIKKQWLYTGIIFVFLVAIPLARSGIIINDELQARGFSMEGLQAFYLHYHSGYINQGRLLASFIMPFFMWMGFVGNGHAFIFKTIQITILIIECGLFGCIVNMILRRKSVAVISSIASFGFLPVVFENMAPNAFVSLQGMPFVLLMIALILFLKGVETNNNRHLAASMLFLLLSEMCYEAFVTYMPLFLMIVVIKYGKQWKCRGRYVVAPVVISIVYIAIYFISSRLYASIYSGNQIGIAGIGSPLRIIAHLFFISLPGVFVFIPKYQYFKSVYNSLDIVDYIRIGGVVILFIVLCISLIKYEDEKESIQMVSSKKKLCILACGMSYMVLPSLPISISSMYQGNVGTDGFLALPITHYEYFAAVFVVVYGCWMLCSYIGGRFYIYAISMAALLLANVQQMNDINSYEQKRNYERIVEIEKFLNTDTARVLANGVYYSKDLYQQQNALAVHDGWWGNYCGSNYGYEVALTTEYSDEIDGIVSYDGEDFSIVNDFESIVFATEQRTGAKAIPVGEGSYELFAFEDNPVRDGDFYIYKRDEEAGRFHSSGFKVLEGMYGDDWLQRESRFQVRIGERGIIELTVYYPGEIDGTQSISFYIENNLHSEYLLKEELNTIKLNVEADSEMTLAMHCDFELMDKGGDTRELSLLLSDFTVQ